MRKLQRLQEIAYIIFFFFPNFCHYQQLVGSITRRGFYNENIIIIIAVQAIFCTGVEGRVILIKISANSKFHPLPMSDNLLSVRAIRTLSNYVIYYF